MAVALFEPQLIAAAAKVDACVPLQSAGPADPAIAQSIAMATDAPERRQGVPADPVLAAFEECYDALLRHVEQRIGNTADAADIVQETYVHVRVTERRTAIANPRAFLYRVATNLAIDYQRRRAYRGQFVSAGEPIDDVASGEPSMERQLAGRERLDALLDAVNELPDRCREVFILCKLYHLDIEEIGQRLRISPTMVRRHLRKALLHCAARLGELE
jgi:RNA polymerase sigma-70 factor (ECF subfamily)